MRARAVQRQRRQGRAGIQALLDGLHFILRHGKLHVDGRQLRHHHHAARVAGAHQIADIDHLQACAAADRRHHFCITQVQSGRAFCGAVRHDGAFQLFHQGGLRIDILARDGILAQQGLIALQRQARVFQLRFIALALARGLHQRHLELRRVDLRHHLARLDHAAFLEFQLLQNTRHLRAHRHGGGGRHRAQRIEHHGQVRFDGRGHAHGGRWTATAPARAAWPARAAHAGAALDAGARVGQVPGTAPQRSHHGQRDDRADDFRTAAAPRGRGCCLRIHRLSLYTPLARRVCGAGRGGAHSGRTTVFRGCFGTQPGESRAESQLKKHRSLA